MTNINLIHPNLYCWFRIKRHSHDNIAAIKFVRNRGQTAVIKTDYRKIKVKLFPEKQPKTVKKIIGSTRQDDYYGRISYRLIPDYMIQSGVPTEAGIDGGITIGLLSLIISFVPAFISLMISGLILLLLIFIFFMIKCHYQTVF